MQLAQMVCALLTFVFFTGNSASAQIFNPAMMADTPASYRVVGFTMPIITATKETVGKIEFNLSGQGAIALEGSLKKKREEVGEETQKETGESMLAEGKGVALLISRYSSGVDMSGFYWGLGVGMREENLDWKVAAEENDPQVNMALVDDKNQFEHRVVAKGSTGHIRIGYRHVGSSLPIAAGIYLGVRHFQAGIEDEKPKDKDDTTYQPPNDPLTDREKERLKRRVATSPEAGIEFGFAF